MYVDIFEELWNFYGFIDKLLCILVGIEVSEDLIVDLFKVFDVVLEGVSVCG